MTASVPAVVCIGSSAGGLASLRAIMGALPASFPWPILITHHFPADVRSHLPEILSRGAQLKVREPIEGERLVAGVVLTSPSAAVMTVSAQGRIEFQPRKRGPPDSIDRLFVTAAPWAGERSVAVVLSGAGWDGAAGARIVKEKGGTVVAESLETAEWGGMPAAVISSGAVDEILPCHAIGPFLLRLAVGKKEQAQ